MFKKNIYLSSRVSLPEGLSPEFLWHVGFLHQRRDDAHPVIDLDILQFVRGKPSQVLAPRIISHAVRAPASGWIRCSMKV
jgi:hypothetical protein